MMKAEIKKKGGEKRNTKPQICNIKLSDADNKCMITQVWKEAAQNMFA